MDKRYQVFVSSTYVDLKEERQSVLQTLMEMDCIPAGMELFPAADEEQWEFIKKVIDDCDYYLLIIGGRYGSTAEDGLSYTEKEFDYAVSKGLKVIALLHKEPDQLPRAKSEVSDEMFQKLQAFRDKVSTGRLIRFWADAGQLPGEVALSLNKTIKTYPATGWVRANSAASPEILNEINELRKHNELLKQELDELKVNTPLFPLDQLADWDSELELKGTYRKYARSIDMDTQYNNWSAETTWSQLFSTIAPLLADQAFDTEVNHFIAQQFSGVRTETPHVSGLSVNQQDLYTIRIQMVALGLVAIDNDDHQAKWLLTDLGMQTMMKMRVVEK